MRARSTDHLKHDHAFLGEEHGRNEQRAWIVVGLTSSTAVGEILGGWAFDSAALLTDGWRMGAHATAITISAAAYRHARCHAADPGFAFGTGKVGELAAYTNAVILAIMALLIGYESVPRLVSPVPITYGEAVAIAVLGLAVSIAGTFVLQDKNDDRQADGHDTRHHPPSHATPANAARDLNLNSAYAHALVGAMMSALAIAGTLLAWASGWRFVSPLFGLAGTTVGVWWAWGLLCDAGGVLVDAVPDAGWTTNTVRCLLERDGDQVTDLHLWQVGPGHFACIVALVSDAPRPPLTYKARLSEIPRLSHVTVEVEPRQRQRPPLRRVA